MNKLLQRYDDVERYAGVVRDWWVVSKEIDSLEDLNKLNSDKHVETAFLRGTIAQELRDQAATDAGFVAEAAGTDIDHIDSCS
jgi:hypothetical protein